MSTETNVGIPAPGGESPAQQSLGTAGARNLATTTKSAPQMQGISPRWLLRMLPWVEVSGGTYRVNRRLRYAVGRGRVGFVKTGSEVRIVPPTLREVPVLRGFEDDAVLEELAGRFVQREFSAGEVLVAAGAPIDEVFIIAHGKLDRLGSGKYGDETVVGSLADGDHLGDEALRQEDGAWPYTVRAATAGTVLAISWPSFQELADRSEALQLQIMDYLAGFEQAQNKHGEAAIGLSAGHRGEYELPGAFVDYELKPREYELSVAQTVLKVHSRVADLYNQPMNQTEHQLRLTIEALRERQEDELVNNPEFGLLQNAEYDQRIQTHSGPPTPDDMDELLSRRRSTKMFLAHPRAIAAFGRECSRRGLYPDTVEVQGRQVFGWRGVPVFPCNKIPIVGGNTSSIIALRTGEDNQGVIGLHQTGIPDEYQPGLSVRFMGISEKAIISYLVSAYYSAAILVPDAVGVLENVDVAHHRD
ncbi:family 2B encapsulin nanocompartment shell protein [Streptomyces sp. CB01881]|uniref:family 2B encapsulin nanocompartment shell protein n=1 Tax=Streptomyces sp. CB01881 TaxID=2078691 RepID=UPI000CDC88C6|nr:family 2B encapsulin nanocompartment shell protein [Streptomyces sp. CB01881]AUY51130.1 Crp/Fnr family transcriptional regulator [Streptomyces sp. CB01881]TYC74515.1 cyclic nucleotide-binding domain-containing protein [Streptomyces sp. CB01881]